ncbi:transposable element Tcb2 transposase [Trichonephila clavipes]|nr:transposable element Tcb2 transposase [Trichonephila clavipes]
MSSRHHIDDFMRGRIIGKIEEGRKITDVAREFDIAHSVVSRLWKSFETTGMISRRHGGGRVRSTTPAEDRYIVLSAKRNRRTTAQQVANQFLAASGKQISRKTVARRLRGGGLYTRRPVVCVPLTRQHRTARLQWCRELHNWTEQDWACVLFLDESRFSLSSDCRRQLIWRESGTAYRPENIQEKDRYPTCSIMVWAGIMINGRTRLHVVANGTMTGQRYIDEVLLPHVRLFRGAVGDKFVFMVDNATCHRTLAVQDSLDSEGIQRLVRPARSPDLNPIENVWDALERQVAGRNYPPTNKNTLIRALTEEWDKLPQQLLDNVVQTLPSSGPDIIGLQPRYQIGDEVNITCSFGPSKPAAKVNWYINGELAQAHHVTHLPPRKTKEGLQWIELRLVFNMTGKYIRKGGLRLQCLAEVFLTYARSHHELVIGESAFDWCVVRLAMAYGTEYNEIVVSVGSLLNEAETDQTREEPHEIMDINHDIKVNLRKAMNMKPLS